MPNQVNFTINGIALVFWLKITPQLATLMVRKAEDTRSIELSFADGGAEAYPVFSITCNGECFRHKGLPVGWGFRLTKDRKIKEVR